MSRKCHLFDHTTAEYFCFLSYAVYLTLWYIFIIYKVCIYMSMFLKYEFAVRVRDLFFTTEDLKGVGTRPHSLSVPDILAL